MLGNTVPGATYRGQLCEALQKLVFCRCELGKPWCHKVKRFPSHDLPWTGKRRSEMIAEMIATGDIAQGTPAR